MEKSRYDLQGAFKCRWKEEPRCYAPYVDATCSRRAYGNWALPKLARELCGSDPNILRQAVSTIADISVNPEEMPQIVRLRIPERLSELLVSADPYLRERVAEICCTMSRQTAGIEAIFKCPKILLHLTAGMTDTLSMIRTRIARVFESLVQNKIAAQDLCDRGFLEKLVDLIMDFENDATILALHLKSLGCLLNNGTSPDIVERAMEINVMERLVETLNIRNNDEDVVVETLRCLSRLCHEERAKQKSIEMDLLSILKEFLNDERTQVRTAAASVVVFTTITTRGKLRALELGVIDTLVRLLATDSRDKLLKVSSIQALTNIAQLPDGRAKLIREHSTFIADIETRGDDTTDKYKNILMEVIDSPICS